MKNILIVSMLAFSFFSCGDKDTIDYPKSYTYSHIEEGAEITVVLLSNGTTQEVSRPPAYTAFIDTLGDFIEHTTQELLFFEEFELLSENTIRIQFIADQVLIDTVFMYSQQDEEIIIDNIDPAFISYNPEEDQFEVCTYARIAINGPNPPVFGSGYGIAIGTCEYADIQAQLNALLDQEIYVTGDTIGLYIQRLIYD